MANWQWFHRLGSPRWLYQTLQRWTPWVTALAVFGIVLALIWGLFFTPPDYKQGNSFRIIYVHVPAAVVALAAYYAMAISGAIGLIWRMMVADLVMRCIAPVGAALTFLALFTGAVWGKPTWGAYWVWQDARLTSMLILFFLYIGVMALYDAFHDSEGANRAASIVALVGTVNIPIIYKSVDWWASLHQPATIKFTEQSTIAAEMFYPLLLAIVATYAFVAAAVMLQLKARILMTESQTNWVRELAERRLSN